MALRYIALLRHRGILSDGMLSSAFPYTALVLVIRNQFSHNYFVTHFSYASVIVTQISFVIVNDLNSRASPQLLEVEIGSCWMRNWRRGLTSKPSGDSVGNYWGRRVGARVTVVCQVPRCDYKSSIVEDYAPTAYLSHPVKFLYYLLA